MPKSKQGDTVKVHYTGKVKDGEVFDSSFDKEPLQFTLGEGQVIQGFEKAVTGMEPGETRTANIPTEEAYGPARDDLVVEVARDDIPEHIDPKTGQRLEVQQADGRKVPVTVTSVSDEKVTLDANHPLAGKNLTFDIKLLEIV